METELFTFHHPLAALALFCTKEDFPQLFRFDSVDHLTLLAVRIWLAIGEQDALFDADLGDVGQYNAG